MLIATSGITSVLGAWGRSKEVWISPAPKVVTWVWMQQCDFQLSIAPWLWWTANPAMLWFSRKFIAKADRLLLTHWAKLIKLAFVVVIYKVFWQAHFVAHWPGMSEASASGRSYMGQLTPGVIIASFDLRLVFCCQTCYLDLKTWHSPTWKCSEALHKAPAWVETFVIYCAPQETGSSHTRVAATLVRLNTLLQNSVRDICSKLWWIF